MTAVKLSGRAGRARARIRALAVLVTGLLVLTACGTGQRGGTGADGGQAGHARAGGGQAQAAAANPDLDPGTPLDSRPAPDFRLVNQFGQPMSLSQFRGKVVILAFTDSRCTTICPLTTASMVAARELLGPASDQVQLLGVDANPQASGVADVLAYSRAHGMVNQWDFLTGSAAALRATWRAYHVYVQIERGQIDHTPALYVIDQRGRERRLYLTTMSYASIGQAAQILAAEAASLLPGHPKLASERSLAYLGGRTPASRLRLPRIPDGSVTLGPGRPHLLLFFATWLTETSDLRARLTGLNSYARAARRERLPGLVAVDETVTEPSAAAAGRYIRRLGQPLRYPVALDTSGRVADGYGVQDQPWLVLTSAAGKVVWKHDGWLPVAALEAAARRASGARQPHVS
jgi:cytochrome oxidase Cu insertion factor (SCO1/SenC/PrrC family)